MLFNYHINNTKISLHGLISRHKQFILNHLQNTFLHQENHVTIHMNSETLGLLFMATKFGIFSTRFKGFEAEFTAKSSLRISLTINMALSQRINKVGKDPYLLELSEFHQIGVHAYPSPCRTTLLLAPSRTDSPNGRKSREKAHTLSLELKTQAHCISFLAPHVFGLLILEKKTLLPFVLILINNFNNSHHVLFIFLFF